MKISLLDQHLINQINLKTLVILKLILNKNQIKYHKWAQSYKCLNQKDY